jgi:TonB family protein
MKPEDYPDGARERREEGLVLMRLEISEIGKTGVVVLSSGFPDLDQAALRIVPDRVKLSPADSDGQTFDTMAVIPVLWSLDGASGK